MPPFRKPFGKKVYTVPQLLVDLQVLLSRPDAVKGIRAGTRVDPRFREQIMLAVAYTNACRYCVFAHSDAALGVGLPGDLVARLAAGDTGGLDPRTQLALTYAMALAESDFDDVAPGIETEGQSRPPAAACATRWRSRTCGRSEPLRRRATSSLHAAATRSTSSATSSLT